MKKLILLFLCAVFAGGLPARAETIKNKTFIDASYTGVKTIKVMQTVLDVNVVRAAAAKTSVKCHVNQMEVNVKNFRIEARQSGSVLEIYQDPRKASWFGRSDGYIRIEAPADVRVIVVNTVSGDVALQGLRLDTFEATTTSGDVALYDCSSGNVSVNSTSGDVALGNLVSELAVVRTTSGDVAVNGCGGNKIDISTVSGDVYAKGSNFGVDFALVGISSTSGDLSVYMGPKVRKTVFKSVSGDIRLYFRGDLKKNSYDLGGVSSSIVLSGFARAKRSLVLNPSNAVVDVRANAVSGDIYIGNY